jgi:anti-anti-sigma factor
MNEASNDLKTGSWRLNLTLESRPQSADRAESQIVQFAARANYAKEQCEEIGLAVRESVANAVLHGNCCDPHKKVFLTAEMQAHGLVIRVRDEGEGFDPAGLPDPLDPVNLHRESGRGLLMIRALMDEAVFERAAPGGMELTMTKSPSKSAQDGDWLKDAGQPGTGVYSGPAGVSDGVESPGRVPPETLPEEKTHMALKLTDRDVDGVTVVTLDGRVVLGEESSALREKVKALLAQGKKKLVLDMKNVSMIDSSGLGALVSAFSTAKTAGAVLRLSSLSERSNQLLQMTKLLTVFEVSTTEADAVRAFSK